ncbi:uncharacterized protein LOC123896707 [Trifolium pratense]|uniref:uncharacterized protein LOC123896707 n=1 Tax=Trifolium pratense TaxID=57577 RepID=UPI001E697EAF|nr:uncharacterized protein LOC123896707 [Trifolium pratense]
MSNPEKSSPMKHDDAHSPTAEDASTVIVKAVPISTVPPTDSTKKKKKSSKKDKPLKVKTNPSSSPASTKESTHKGKKSKSETSRAFTMSELHVNPITPNVATPVVDSAEENVEAPGKTSEILDHEHTIVDETLGTENVTMSKKLGKNDFTPSVTVDETIGAPTKTNVVVAEKSHKDTIPETNVESSVPTDGATKTTVVPDAATSLAHKAGEPILEQVMNPTVETTQTGTGIVSYSESDESEKSQSDKEADRTLSDDPDIVINDEIVAGDKSITTNPEASVARRTRSRAGKGLTTVSTPVQTPDPAKSVKDTGKNRLFGPPKDKSKVAPSTEEKKKSLKRKAPPSDASDDDYGTEVAASGSTSRKSIGRRKVPLSVPYAPLDNVSFHLENGSSRWKFVYHRRLALERNLKEDILKCKSVNEALEYAESPEYRQVFVRGKCVKFSPSIVNQYLQRSADDAAELEVTDNTICKTLTGGVLKVWGKNAKVAATQLTPMYAILNRIAAHNWVPTTHSSDVSRSLGKFIYAVGTKFPFDYGSYIFYETLTHAVSFAVEKPIAFPTLLCNIILEQHPDILTAADVTCVRPGKLVIEQRLIAETDAAAGVGPSVPKKTAKLSRRQMIADLTETSRALAARKLKIDRVIESLKAEEVAASGKGEHSKQMEDEEADSDPDTDESVDHSGSSSD